MAYLKKLKIYAALSILEKEILERPVVKIVAPTGTGKTVGISHHLLLQLSENLNYNDKMILISIPTIICAKWQFDYCRQMLPDKRHLIGFRAGGEGENEKDARLLFGTTQSITNILLTMYHKKENMSKVIVMIDEAHHPSSENYILQGLCNWLLSKQIPINVIIASATPSKHDFHHLNETYDIIVEQPQQQLSINWHHEPNIQMIYEQDKQFKIVCQKVKEIIESTPETHNDIIIFASGEEIIEQLAGYFVKTYPSISIHSAYSGVSREELYLINQPEDKRKIIIGTNIIESGVTIDGITHVIDMLRHKIKHVNQNGIESLVETWISQASSYQRRGRAGRTRKGFYYPMCSQDEFITLSPYIDNEFHISPKHNHVISLMARQLPADEILMILSDEYRNLIAELCALQLINHTATSANPHIATSANPHTATSANPHTATNLYTVTSLGHSVSKFPTSINTTVTLLRQKELFPPTNHYNYHIMVYLIMMMALAETKKSIPNIYYVPPAIRRMGKDAKQEYIYTEFDKFRSTTEFGILMKIFLNMLLTSDNGKVRYEWAVKEKIVGKYIDQSFRLFKQLYFLIFDTTVPYHMQHVYEKLESMIDTPDTITIMSQALARGYFKAVFTLSNYTYINEYSEIKYKINDKSLATCPHASKIVAIQPIEIKTKRGSIYILTQWMPFIDVATSLLK